MKKFNEFRLVTKALIVYFLSIITSLILYFPFSNLYSFLFHPIKSGGGIFLPISSSFDSSLSGAIIGYVFFVSFYVFCFFSEKKYTIWIIGSSIPFALFLLGGGLIIFVKIFIISLTGGLIGWLINLAIKKLKK